MSLRAEDLDEFIDSNEWVFAKTMADNPHWYVIEKRSVDPELFARVVIHIKTKGASRKYHGYSFRYIDHDGHSYWVTWGNDAGLGEMGGYIINRKKTDEAGWDA